MNPSTRSTADVVVIGGGIMGASTAYHLARRGVKRVVLLEKEEMFGLGSTGQNAGGFRYQFASAVNIHLSTRSIAMMERFAEEMGQEVAMKRCGYLFMLSDEGDLAQFRRNVALQNSLGVPSREVTVDEIARLAPELDLTGIIGGTWCPRDGLVDPHGLLQGYVSNARRLGAELRTDARVTGIDVANGAVRAVSTEGGTIATPCVVIAAGAWSAGLGALAGVDLPVSPILRQIAVTAPIDGLRPDFPFVIDFSNALYFHREGNAILTGMSNRDQAPGFDIGVDEEWRHHHLEHAIARLPMLGESAIAAEWGGLYEVTPDHQPVIGRHPEVEGLLACAGFSGHGMMHGPAAGLLLAEEIVDGAATTIDIGELRWDRFARGRPATEYNVV